MAISDDLPGVTVTIDTSDGPLKEYEDTDEESPERTTTRYIEARSDQEFKVSITVDKGTKFLGSALSFKISTDGESTADAVITKRKCAKGPHTSIRDGISLPGKMVRKFKFASLETVTDGRMIKGESQGLKHLGSIKVDVLHRNGRSTKKVVASNKGVKQMDFISEKALKGRAVSHNVGFGEAVKGRRITLFQPKPVRGAEDPVAVFVFIYRSMESLKSMLIIPRTPSPQPLEARPFEELSMEDLRELHRRAQQAQEERETAVKIKREKKDDDHLRLRRKRARPSQGDTQLEIDDDGDFRESSTASLPRRVDPKVIELD